MIHGERQQEMAAGKMDLESLVTRAQRGDVDAFDRLVRQFQDIAFGYAYSILGDVHLAEDAAQEAFIGAYRTLPQLRAAAAFSGWLQRIVFRSCLLLRRGRRIETVPLEAAAELVSPEPGPWALAEARATRDEILEAVRRLPEAEREAISLFYISGHSEREVGQFLGIPATTVKNRLRSGRKKLKERMLMRASKKLREQAPSQDPQFAEKIRRMIQPEPLKRAEPLTWSPGMGTDVWRMFCAAITGDLGTIKRLVKKDPRLVNCEYAYFTPLHFAARENQKEVVACLVERGADPTSSPGTGWHELPLTLAADRGYTELQQWLEAHLAEKHCVAPEGEAIARAIRDRDTERLHSLLNEAPERVHAADARGNQPIHWAVMTRQTALIDALLERGAAINARRPDGARPLDLTNGDYWYRGRDVPPDALREHLVLTGFLIARGADYDLSTAARLGDTRRVRALLEANPGLVNSVPSFSTPYPGLPLRHAAAGGHRETVRLLLERGADPNVPEPGGPHGMALYETVARNDLEIARLLLEHGANPNAEVEGSGDCCWRARRDGHTAMLELLSAYGGAPVFANCCYSGWIDTVAAMLKANPSLVEDPDAITYAVTEGHAEIIRLFLRHDPDAAKKLPGGESGFKSPEIARLLLENGLDPKGANWLRVTALHFFALRGRQEFAELFLDYGADIDARDEEYRSTPLGWAARGGRKEMVEFLLGRGAKTNLPDDPPWATPLAWAERRGHPEIAQILRQHGASA
jgi:RNA polymerase sigma factor (sigma-70 family)